jgi:hypothetical protein
MKLTYRLFGAVCVLLVSAILLSPNAFANEAPEIDDGVYCWGIYSGWNDFWSDGKIKWGPACQITVQCGGFASGGVGIHYPVNGHMMRVEWGFEYVDPEDPSYTPEVCAGIFDFYPVETPRVDFNCGGKNPINVRVNLSRCDWDWILY